MHSNSRFTSPQHMSRSAIPVMFFKLLKSETEEFIAFIIILLIGNNSISLYRKLLYPLIGIVLYVLYIAVKTLFRYFFFKFYIEEDKLIVNRGLFRKEKINIPLNRIHSLRTNSGMFYRLFDMKGISFDTLASKNKEVELILDDKDWNEFSEIIQGQEKECNETSEQDGNANDEIKQENETSEIKLSNLTLLKGGFCQNHLKGTLIMAAALFALIAKADFDILETASLYAIDNVGNITVGFTSVLVIIVSLYVISLILWLARIILLYYDTRLKMSDSDLFFESGLITRRSIRFNYDKVSSISVKQNIFEKKADIATIKLNQAYNVTDKENKGSVLLYGCPVSERLIKWWLGDRHRLSERILQLKSGKGLFIYSVRLSVLISVIALFLTFRYDYLILGAATLLYLIISVIQGILTVRNSSITVSEDFITLFSGSFAKRETYIKFEDVEHIKIRQTPFTKYSGRAHLTIYTNGAALMIRSIPLKGAYEAYDIILNRQY